ncbi:MAG: DUF4198 domain-containing protein [Pirellulales bacterium]
MKKSVFCFSLFLTLLCCSPSKGHDTWIEAGPLVQQLGEYTYVNLMLGNHGNEHRDFKLASKITLTHCTLTCTTPSATVLDLKPRIIDMGSAAKEGYWAARCDLMEPGVHEFLHTLNALHGTVKAVKSAKTYVIAEGASSSPAATQFQPKVLGLGLELQLLSNLNQVAAGSPLKIQVLRSGKPLADARVTFVPRGVVLAEGVDSKYEKMSDSKGIVSFTPDQGNVVLAIVHHVDESEKGEGFERTHYGAAMVLPVRNKPSVQVERQ